jgi:hypothetical protein
MKVFFSDLFKIVLISRSYELITYIKSYFVEHFRPRPCLDHVGVRPPSSSSHHRLELSLFTGEDQKHYCI